MSDNRFPRVWEFLHDRYFPDHSGELDAEGSVIDYEIQVGHFCAYWLEKCVTSGRGYRPPTIVDLTREEIKAAMAWQAARGRTPATVNKLRRVLRAIAGHAAEVYADVPAPKKVKSYREPKRKPSSWSMDQFGLLLGVAQQLVGTVGDVSLADFVTCWLWTQYNTGSRISAMMAIRWESIDFSESVLSLEAETTKDKEEQRVTLVPEAVEALLKMRVGSASGPFDHWPHDRGPGQRGWPALTKLLKKIVYAALIDPNSDVNTLTNKQVKAVVGRRDCTHKVRRTFATEVAAREGLEAARDLLGHSSLQVTARYVDESKLPRRSQRDILPRPVARQPKKTADAKQLKLFAG